MLMIHTCKKGNINNKNLKGGEPTPQSQADKIGAASTSNRGVPSLIPSRYGTGTPESSRTSRLAN